MSTPEKDTAETVEKLLAERRKVAGWISALAAKRGETPPAVYQKVHDDYTAKLAKVQAELRAAVGEFSEREWEKRRTKLDDEVGVVTGERDTLRDELRRLRDVLAEGAGTGPAVGG